MNVLCRTGGYGSAGLQLLPGCLHVSFTPKLTQAYSPATTHRLKYAQSCCAVGRKTLTLVELLDWFCAEPLVLQQHQSVDSMHQTRFKLKQV